MQHINALFFPLSFRRFWDTFTQKAAALLVCSAFTHLLVFSDTPVKVAQCQTREKQPLVAATSDHPKVSFPTGIHQTNCTACSLIVTTTADTGLGSLREAILCANGQPGPDTIQFNIPGVGPHFIKPATVLPKLLDKGTFIAGQTQPGWNPGILVIDCAGFSAGTSCFGVLADSCVIDGLYIYNASVGVAVQSAKHVRIGSAMYGNTISGPQSGVGIEGFMVENLLVEGNRIGVLPDVASTDAQKMCCGIRLLQTQNVLVRSNTVGGITHEGIYAEGDSIEIRGNFLGTDAAGLLRLPNNVNLLVGNTTTRRVQIKGNVVANALYSGIVIDMAAQVDIYNNIMYCNALFGIRVINGANGGITNPTLNTALVGEVTGTSSVALPGRVELYKASFCPSPAVCAQGKTLIASATVNDLSNWSIQSPDIHAGDTLTAFMTVNGGAFQGQSSPFSPCVVVCNIPSPQIIGSTTFCAGGTTSLSATPGFAQYAWSSGQTTATIAANAAQTYTLTVRDAAGCTGTATVEITQGPEITITLVPTPSSACTGSGNGTIRLSTNSGNTGHVYAWSNGATTRDIDNLSAGTYTVTVRDAAGCSDSATATVGQSGTHVAQTLRKLMCAGDSVLIGSRYYTTSGKYTYVKTGHSGQCDTTVTVDLMVQAVQAMLTASPAGLCGAGKTMLSLHTNNCPGCDYEWSEPTWTGGAARTIQIKATTRYTVTVASEYGCTTIASIEVPVWAGDTVRIDTVLCPGNRLLFCGLNRNKTGAFICKGLSKDGCDSVTMLQLTVLDAGDIKVLADTFTLEQNVESIKADVLRNDHLANGVPWKITIVRPPAAGTAEIHSDTLLLYTPPQEADFIGLDSLIYGIEYAPCAGSLLRATAFFFINGNLKRFEKIIPNVVKPEADNWNNHFDPLSILRENGLPFTEDEAELSILDRFGSVVWRSGKPYRRASREDLQQLPNGQYYYLLKIRGQVLKGPVGKL